jgi:hypothetical protein
VAQYQRSCHEVRAFSIGFIFDEGCRAECEQSDEYGLVYYLSPAEIVKNQKYNSRSFKARFSSAWAGRYEIMSLATYEFVHGAFGIGLLFASSYPVRKDVH